MKYVTITLFFAAVTGMYFLWPEPTELEPQEFAGALEKTPNNLLIDLRPSRDFSKGHISGATNVDSGWPTYKWRIAELDTSLQIFLYCQNGERSAKTAAYMRSQGFGFITVLKGGLKSWLSKEYTLTPEELVPPSELTFEHFSRMLDLEHLVVVDFYLPGDKHCREMAASLDELAIDYGGKIKMLRIDIDLYKHLATEMGIESVPTLQFYENGNLIKSIEGVHDKDRIEDAFRLKEYCTPAVQKTAQIASGDERIICSVSPVD
jgi:rhodanese-related sulfurtransferase